MLNSTRRFFARASGVVPGTAGWVAALPEALKVNPESSDFPAKTAFTALARFSLNT